LKGVPVVIPYTITRTVIYKEKNPTKPHLQTEANREKHKHSHLIKVKKKPAIDECNEERNTCNESLNIKKKEVYTGVSTVHGALCDPGLTCQIGASLGGRQQSDRKFSSPYLAPLFSVGAGRAGI
jgi:hypothetical protein